MRYLTFFLTLVLVADSLAQGHTADPIDSLESALTELLTTKALSVFEVGYSKCNTVVASNYVLCDKWASDSMTQIEQFSVIGNQLETNSDIGTLWTIKSSPDHMFNPGDSIIGLYTQSSSFASLPFMEIGTRTERLRKLLKDRISYAMDMKTKNGETFVVLTTKWFHIAVVCEDDIIASVTIHRICK